MRVRKQTTAMAIPTQALPLNPPSGLWLPLMLPTPVRSSTLGISLTVVASVGSAVAGGGRRSWLLLVGIMGKVGILVGVFEGVSEGGAVLGDWDIELRVGTGVGPFVGSSVGTFDGQMVTLRRSDGAVLLDGAMLVVGRAVVGSSPVGGSLFSPIESEVTEQMLRKYSCICVLRDLGVC